jgi:hypothetical protein
LTSYPYLDLGSEDYRDNGGNAEEYAYRSLFGRMTYSYADRYLIHSNTLVLFYNIEEKT